MNPFLAEEYSTLNNVRGLRLCARGNEKVAGLVDSFLARRGIGPGQGGVLQQILFPMLSQASSWTLRDSTAPIPKWLNQFQALQKGPQVFNDALANFQAFMTGGGGPQTALQTVGQLVPGMPSY